MALFDITFLNANLTTIGAGASAYAWSGAPANLSAAQQASYEGSTVPSASGIADANGHIQVSLAPSTLTLFAVNGFQGAYGTTPAASGAMYVILYPSSNLCTVFGHVIGEDGTPQARVNVTANLNASGPVLSTSLVLSQTTSTTTDATGFWALDLIPNDLIIIPKNTLYTFIFQMPAPAPTVQPFFAFASTVQAHGATVSRAVEVPNVPSVDFATLV